MNYSDPRARAMARTLANTLAAASIALLVTMPGPEARAQTAGEAPDAPCDLVVSATDTGQVILRETFPTCAAATAAQATLLFHWLGAPPQDGVYAVSIVRQP